MEINVMTALRILIVVLIRIGMQGKR